MIPQADRRILKTQVPDFSADRSKYKAILSDMLENAGVLMPSANWLELGNVSRSADSYDLKRSLETVLSDSHFEAWTSHFKGLMAPWVGTRKSATPKVAERYQRFLANFDPLGLWKDNARDVPSMLASDLGSLMDVNLLYTFRPAGTSDVTTVLEIGGGYGRLAESMWNVFGRSVRYVIVDAVPASLYYAPEYLRRACPDARVGSYSDKQDLDFRDFDIVIVPAWHFERLNRIQYDICVNIESMQEMDQRHVDHYLQLIDSVATPGATIYLSNSHEYYFRGEFRYPATWERLVATNTPRSWTIDHPTEIFRKSNGDFRSRNEAHYALQQFAVEELSNPERAIYRGSYGRVLFAFFKRTLMPIAWRLLELKDRVSSRK